MTTIIITNCTSRKRRFGGPPTSLEKKLHGGLDSLAQHWHGKIQNSSSTTTAESLYVGRSVTEAKRVSELLGADLMFASTGLGLIASTALSPAYDLTVSLGESSIIPHLVRCEATTADWWDTINFKLGKRHAIAQIVGNPEVKIVLIALSSNYIKMILNDLNNIANADIKKLRIFTSRPGTETLPEAIRAMTLPYDDRLESSNFVGTRNDFPQRAMRHYIEEIYVDQMDINASRVCVQKAMQALSLRKHPARRKTSDEEIRRLLIVSWHGHGGSSTRLLRHLRDEVLVACEQSRFQKIWKSLKNNFDQGIA
jgi:hypothetical protein